MEVNCHLTEKAQRDYKLVRQAIQDGHQQAYAELMNNYRDSLYYMLLKMTNNATDAEDLTIEAFGKAFRNLPQYTPEYAFSTWLFRIAANNCIDFLRKNRRIQFAEGILNDDNEYTDYPANIPANTPAPDERVISKQKIQVMREVVDRLKPHYKTLVELRYYKEYSYEEISSELNLPLGTVKAQLFRARDLLFQILKDKQEKF